MLGFSILYRIDACVTQQHKRASYGGCGFQYPLSDRCLCNTATSTLLASDVYCFSILYRIDACVTVGLYGDLVAVVSFSILYRIDACVTVKFCGALMFSLCVSVSSIGSMPV